MPASSMPPDRFNEIGVLKRREIEARIIAPLLEALGREFGRERVLEVARRVIIGVARQQGAQLAEEAGGNTLLHFAGSLAAWKKDDAMEIEVLEQNERKFAFNVTRCRYAEMYRALGIPELGTWLSCNRDFSLIEGFNPDVRLRRTQTIVEGAAYCDFRFEARPGGPPPTNGSHPELVEGAGRPARGGLRAGDAEEAGAEARATFRYFA